MQKSTVILIAVIAFVLGLVAGVGVVSLKGTPPVMTAQPAAPGAPSAPAPAQPPSAEIKAQIADIEKRVKEQPNNLALLVDAGNLLFDQQMFQECLKYYEKAIEIGGENPDVITDAGIAYRQLGQPEKAVEYFRRAYKADPKHVNSVLNLGVVLFHDLQDQKGALEAWRQYLALGPTGERAEMIKRVVVQIEAGLPAGGK